MGFFSWKTADTNESIFNKYTEFCRPVYMLQPNGKPPISEPEYEGYGTFGGHDAHVWLALHNLSQEKIDEIENNSSLSEEDKHKHLIMTGVTMANGLKHFQDTETGQKWTIFIDVDSSLIGEHKYFEGRFNDIIPEYNKSANELLDSGQFQKIYISADNLSYQLKFSFNKNAVYEELPPSKDCPYQGYFYDPEEDDAMRM